MNKEVLHIGVSENAGTTVLRLTGELDSYTSGRFSRIGKAWIKKARKVVVHVDGLDYIDSSGLTVLVSLWVNAKEKGLPLVISCRNPRIHRILEITGLLKLFTVVTSASVRHPAVGNVHTVLNTHQAGGLAASEQAGSSSPLRVAAIGSSAADRAKNRPDLVRIPVQEPGKPRLVGKEDHREQAAGEAGTSSDPA